MQSLKELLEENKKDTIFTIAQFIEKHIAENWQIILKKNHDQLMDAYHKAGDMAYGTYLNLLYLTIHQQLKEAKLNPHPRLPGDFDISREWGQNAEGTDQQRWMWSTIHQIKTGEPIGTIVTIVFHDHTQFRLPRSPQIIGLTETTKDTIVEVLSQQSNDFKHALEFTVEYAKYLENQNG
ncbi:DUF6022 family protein [Shimazuella alba]|uniref:Uncharacterized protein n=1 Tax=Shimazuella alba TaxID=2690964 RepID=A0A6I4VXQ7_9BACL|nr:DUF6022 family protein [Shimazuella alba]MXQ55318.1 hypothetical protein [Shimazuella alba]